MKKKYFLLLMLVLSGMPLTSRLAAQDSLTVNFTGMTPHVGQDLYLFLRDPVDGHDIDSVLVLPVDTSVFEVSFADLVTGNSYVLDFYADLNMNGYYDVPPTDHAWRIQLDSISGDTTINFVHNTDFTDITWEDSDTTDTTAVYKIILAFVGMTPHIDQDLTVYLRSPSSGANYDTKMVSPIDTANFSVEFDSVAADSSYYLDFWADLNDNGEYDVPPTDHAWRLMVNNLESDTTLTFTHNTDFTDITWDTTGGGGDDSTLYSVTLHLTQMAPHDGQNMTFYIEDAESGEALDSLNVSPVDSSDFTVIFDSVQGSADYNLDFWADLNTNGMYDVPPTDHAWRIEITNIQGDTTIEFVHNTNFTDIFEVGDTTSTDTTYNLTVHFTAMDSIDGTDFLIFLRDPETGEYIDSTSVSAVDTANFIIVFEDVDVNVDYNLDFYADINNNGSYDMPPGDQAWRISLSNIVSDTTVIFVYNNNYTDIDIEVGTGVGTIDEESGLAIFPNPARDLLTITFKKSGSGISIFNTAGALVLKRSLAPAEKQVQLNVSTLKPGIYILRLESESGSSHLKFMKE